jgi:hypothetical protein
MLNGRRQPSLGRTSRVNREVYARFCERLAVRFRGPTRQPAVRNFRGGNGNVGIIRSPVRAIALPDSRLYVNLDS